MHTLRTLIAAAVVMLALAGCGGGPQPQTVTVTGVDYGFEGVPGEVAVGSTLTLTNASDVEVHEIVALRIPDDVDLSAEELLQLPEEELEDLLPPGPPAMVLVAAPGEDGFAAVGDGTLTEPGRYALVCFIPTGADPDELFAAFEAADGGPPPEVAGGPPHAFQGMFADLTVTE